MFEFRLISYWITRKTIPMMVFGCDNWTQKLGNIYEKQSIVKMSWFFNINTFILRIIPMFVVRQQATELPPELVFQPSWKGTKLNKFSEKIFCTGLSFWLKKDDYIIYSLDFSIKCKINWRLPSIIVDEITPIIPFHIFWKFQKVQFRVLRFLTNFWEHHHFTVLVFLFCLFPSVFWYAGLNSTRFLPYIVVSYLVGASFWPFRIFRVP